MRVPSRRMPSVHEPSAAVTHVVMALLFCISFVTIDLNPTFALFAVPPAIAILFWRDCSEKRHHERLLAGRTSGDIGAFARSFPRREIDTWVIRAVWDEVQAALTYPRNKQNFFPLLADDRLIEDLRIDSEELEWMVIDIARRSGRSLRDYETNPHYSQVRSVGDVVRFLNSQPKFQPSSA